MWRIAGIVISLLLLLTLVLYQQTVLYLVGLWNNYEIGEYGHGYLVLAISLYLIIQRRRELATLTPCPNYWALVVVVASSLLWLIAVLVDVNMMHAVALLALVLAIVWTVMGNRVTRVLMFPILFIGFAIPVWFPLSPLLQDLTADVVFWFIRLLEVPALRQENMIVVPAGKLSIEGACSGLRYLLAALTLGTLYAYLNYHTLRARVIVVVIAAAAAVLANFVRVFIVVYLGYSTDMQHPLVHDHLMLGWYLFGGLVAALLFIDARLYRHYQPAENVRETDQQIMSEDTNPVSCTKGRFSVLAMAVVSAILISFGPAAAYKVNQQAQAKNEHYVINLPTGGGGWEGPLESNDDWLPVYHGAVTQKQSYQKDGDKVILYVGYYPLQKQGEELINDLNRINNKDIWRTHYPRARLKQINDQQILEQLLVNNDGKQRLVWYWYRVAGQNTANKYEAKLLQILGLVTGEQQAYVTAVAMDNNDDKEHARNVLREYVTIMEKPLNTLNVSKVARMK